MSPIFASKEILRQFPSVVLLTTTLDPCLDENVEMAKKLKAAGVDIKLTVLHDLVHGFLHLIRVEYIYIFFFIEFTIEMKSECDFFLEKKEKIDLMDCLRNLLALK